MQSAVRYCITVGVALGGVSIIVAAPAAPPVPDVQVPAVELSVGAHDTPDVNSLSIRDLLQVIYGFESPDVVVQNITESDTGSPGGDQPSNVPDLSELLNLGAGPAGANVGQLGKGSLGDPAPILQSIVNDPQTADSLGTFGVNIGMPAPGDLGAVPASPSSPGG